MKVQSLSLGTLGGQMAPAAYLQSTPGGTGYAASIRPCGRPSTLNPNNAPPNMCPLGMPTIDLEVKFDVAGDFVDGFVANVLPCVWEGFIEGTSHGFDCVVKLSNTFGTSVWLCTLDGAAAGIKIIGQDPTGQYIPGPGNKPIAVTWR